MNLKKLFEMQKVLDDRIIKEHGLEGQDLLPKKILALQVELGECANEWRGFKMWSKRQTPKEPEYNWKPNEDGSNLVWEPAYGYKSYPLLEEYVDCLHFILSIGLSDPSLCVHDWDYIPRKDETVINQFGSIFFHLAIFNESYVDGDYEVVLTYILGLGEILGFTWDQIESAYMDKNSVNHDRQTNGY